ncbi:hypothetical protein [Terasakiella pusilla]|uniref:hypothetical protein n=1 Tax=Terasakiella pusilla TaxID=64973 RepID=UPI0004911F59|nr:hypothetical protein [Terasakiella pusilla]
MNSVNSLVIRKAPFVRNGARAEQPDIAAWVRFFFSVEKVANDTEEAAEKSNLHERNEYQAGLKDLRELQNQVWAHVAITATR